MAQTRMMSTLVAVALALTVARAQQPATTSVVRAIRPPAVGLPPEEASSNVTRFSFIAYGDTRGQVDGRELQPDHTRVIDAMLGAIQTQATAGFPVRFVLQSGDAVTNGGMVDQWNLRFIDQIERLTRDGGVPYFFAVGNHDVGGGAAGSAEREPRLRNVASAMVNLWPPEGSPRRLNGYPTFAFGFGRYFFIALDSDIPNDQTQLTWVTRQLETLDRQRFPHIVAFFHHPAITAGSHGGSTVVEPQSEAIRRLYLPLFRRHHVRLIITGHDHLLDHWVERYDDASGTHRMDQLVSGGGGAPTYVYLGEPNLNAYAETAAPTHVVLEHLARPGPEVANNPHHFTLLEVDGDRLWVQAVGTGTTPFRPYGVERLELTDR